MHEALLPRRGRAARRGRAPLEVRRQVRFRHRGRRSSLPEWLRRLARSGEVSPDRATEAIADLVDLDLHRHGHLDLLTRAWKLRDNITAYDAVYVALAEALGATVVTCDAPLGKAPGHRAPGAYPCRNRRKPNWANSSAPVTSPAALRLRGGVHGLDRVTAGLFVGL